MKKDEKQESTLITVKQFLKEYNESAEWTSQKLRYQRLKAVRPKVRFINVLGGYRIELVDGSPYLKSV